MKSPQNQKQLFSNSFLNNKKEERNTQLQLSKKELQDWQAKICSFQESLFLNQKNYHKQEELFTEKTSNNDSAYNLNPLELSALSLNFWRLIESPYKGPALYFVIDRTSSFTSPILLYIGETIAAEKRWKGDHDCKSYISAYSETLSLAEIPFQLSIRFWTAVPKDTKARRKIEQLLIQKWQPPFNKENQKKWKTPFTVDI